MPFSTVPTSIGENGQEDYETEAQNSVRNLAAHFATVLSLKNEKASIPKEADEEEINFSKGEVKGDDVQKGSKQTSRRRRDFSLDNVMSFRFDKFDKEESEDGDEYDSADFTSADSDDDEEDNTAPEMAAAANTGINELQRELDSVDEKFNASTQGDTDLDFGKFDASINRINALDFGKFDKSVQRDGDLDFGQFDASIRQDNDLVVVNEECEMDEEDRLEEGVSDDDADPEQSHASKDTDCQSVSNPAHSIEQSPVKSVQFGMQRIEKYPDGNSEDDDISTTKSDETWKSWKPLVIACALLMLAAVIAGITIIALRTRQRSPSSPTPFSSIEPSRRPTTKPSLFESESTTYPSHSVPSPYPPRASNSPSSLRLPTPDNILLQPTSSPIKTAAPTENPTRAPIRFPTEVPATNPTRNPTVVLTRSPTATPTRSPTLYPTLHPTANPTTDPTAIPTTYPSVTPTRNPTKIPTIDPSSNPTKYPTAIPTWYPTVKPSIQPIQRPINDVCVDAIGPLTTDFSSNFGTIFNAGLDNVDRCEGLLDSGPGVWYYAIGTGGEMMAHTCMDTNFNSKVVVFGGTCGRSICIEANDDFCGSDGSQSAVSWNSNFGEVYHILVAGNSDYRDGSFNLVVGARSNDECSTAIGPLPVGDPIKLLGSTSSASTNDVTCGDYTNESKSVWYLVKGIGTEITVDLCEETNFSARVTILAGSCWNFECVAVNPGDGTCSVTWKSDLSRDYYVLIGGQDTDDAGSFSLRLSLAGL